MTLRFDENGRRIIFTPTPFFAESAGRFIEPIHPVLGEAEHLLHIIDGFFAKKYPERYKGVPKVVVAPSSKDIYYDTKQRIIFIGLRFKTLRANLKRILIHEYLHHLGFKHDVGFRSHMDKDFLSPRFTQEIFGGES